MDRAGCARNKEQSAGSKEGSFSRPARECGGNVGLPVSNHDLAARGGLAQTMLVLVLVVILHSSWCKFKMRLISPLGNQIQIVASRVQHVESPRDLDE